MKRIHFYIIYLTIISKLSAQVWQPVSTGLSGLSTEFGRCFTVYNSKLIVGGDFSSAGGNFCDNVAAWDGANWSVLGTGLQATPNSIGKGIYALAVFNNELYAGGSFTASATTTLCNLAKWNGTNWSSINISMSDTLTWFNPALARVKSFCVFNNELYVGGNFTRVNGVSANYIAKWNGSTWIPLGSGMLVPYGNGYLDGVVNAITVYNNEIYAAGNFTNAGGVAVQNIAKWNGSNWSAVGTGIPSNALGMGITSLAVYNNELYAGNGVSGVSKWNGTNWTTVGGGLTPATSRAKSMCIHNGKLIIGGDFGNSGLLTNTSAISAWDGINWNHIGGYLNLYSGLGNTSEVHGVVSYNSCLFATGPFNESLDNPQTLNLNHITQFCGTIGIKEFNKDKSIKILPNPSSGIFNISGDGSLSLILIYDQKGSEIYREIKSGEDIRIDLSSMHTGLYMIKTINDTGEIHTGRLIKE